MEEPWTRWWPRVLAWLGTLTLLGRHVRLKKNFTYANHIPCTNTNLITSEKLTEFFQDHLKEKPLDLQPEVITLGLYPHVLTPDDINISTDITTVPEVNDARKPFKNGKCQGTDKIYGEEMKYNSSNRVMIYLMLLISTIWSSCILPSSWLISSITCLFKNKGSRSEAANYRVFQSWQHVQK